MKNTATLPGFATSITDTAKFDREFKQSKVSVVVKHHTVIIANEDESIHIFPDELVGIQEMLEQAREFLFGAAGNSDVKV